MSASISDRVNRLKVRSISAAAIFCSPLSFGADIQSLINDPDAARAFAYCAWTVGQETQPEFSPRLKEILANPRAGESEKMIASAVLVEAGLKISLAAKTEKLCKRELKKGESLFNKVLRRHARTIRKNGDFESSGDPEIIAVQSEISRLWIQDQAARVTYTDLKTDDVDGAEYWAAQISVANAVLADSEASVFMMNILESNDWIDSHRFGSRTSRQAWTLAQHADKHVDFQKLVLGRMEPYLEIGGVLRRDYAYLWDRVAVNTGQLQRYGTQPTWKCSDGKLVLHPMEDPENVDRRRADMGMGPAADDLAEMARNTCK